MFGADQGIRGIAAEGQAVQDGDRLSGSQHKAQVCGKLPVSRVILPGSAVQVADLLFIEFELVPAFSLQLRSPLVLRCVEDYLAGRRYPLDALIEHG